MRVSVEGNQPPVDGSELAIETLALASGDRLQCGAQGGDTIVLALAETGEASATLTIAGETSELSAPGGSCVRATIGGGVDRHAPMGERQHTVTVGSGDAQGATGKRTFEILYGPHNGCLGATLFVGYVPPGAAPWHFHLYDEIVWIWRGEGRFHTRAGSEPLGAGSAFRIRPREVHVVENTSPTDELVVVGLFTPAGSPSAAYLADDVDVPYAIEAA